MNSKNRPEFELLQFGPENKVSHKERLVSQPPFFGGGYVSFLGSVVSLIHVEAYFLLSPEPSTCTNKKWQQLVMPRLIIALDSR